MIDEARLRELLHEIVAELVTNLFIIGVHNYSNVQDMSDQLHKRIDTLTDE